MSYKPRTLFRLIEEMNVSLFLPHIQRPFVWEEAQMRRLFDSLMRNYPIQTLLFWRTKDAINIRRFMSTVEWDADLHEYYEKSKAAKGVEKVLVLDGQQRLQSLFALFAGSIKGGDGKTDLFAYFDVTSGAVTDDEGILHPIHFATASPGPVYYRLRALREQDAQKNAEEISDELNESFDQVLEDEGEARKARQKQVRRNISQLVSLLREEKHFWIQELDGVANEYPYDRIRDIFVRVNSGGTKLDPGDLMFAVMKADWGEVEEKVEQTVAVLNGGRLSFDKDFALKCLVVAHNRGAELGPEKFVTADGDRLLGQIEADWPRAEETFKQLRDFVENELKVYSDKVVRSYGSFIPIFDYLYHNPKPDPKNRALLRGYYYKSQLFNWYGARTDQLINVMHGFVGKPREDGFPINEIKDYFSRSRKLDVELQMKHLQDIRLRFIILNVMYVERFGSSPFNVVFKGNEPQVDHIYPQSSLRTKLHLETSEVNHLGNYRYFGASDNQRKRAELPAEYFARMKAGGVDVGKHLLLQEYSDDPSRLTFDVATYRDFRDRRVRAIFEIASKVVNPELP